MLQRFFEVPVGADAGADFAPLFRGLAIWEAEDGRFREHQGAYPVVRFALNDAKRPTWEETQRALAFNIVAEYLRHDYLEESALSVGKGARPICRDRRNAADSERFFSLRANAQAAHDASAQALRAAGRLAHRRVRRASDDRVFRWVL